MPAKNLIGLVIYHNPQKAATAMYICFLVNSTSYN